MTVSAESAECKQTDVRQTDTKRLHGARARVGFEKIASRAPSAETREPL